MNEKASTFQQYIAVAKSIGLIVCVAALAMSVRLSIFEPAKPKESHEAPLRLRGLLFAMEEYYVEWDAYPPHASADPAPPPQLTTPISYLKSSVIDPYAPGPEAADADLDPTGRGPVRQVIMTLIFMFAVRMGFVILRRGRWQKELEQGGADFWAGGLVLSLGIVAAYLLSPAYLRMTALLAVGGGAFGMFALRRITQGGLLLVGLTACGIVFALLTERVGLLHFAMFTALLAGVRTGLFYWTLRVRQSRGSLGYYEINVPGQSFLFPLTLYLTLASTIALLSLGQAQLNEAGEIRRIAQGSAPIRIESRPDFFALSSNGPDLAPSWRADVLNRLLEEEGGSAASSYLGVHTYDPTNGVRSKGDHLIHQGRPRKEN